MVTLAPCPRCKGKTYIDKEDRRIACFICGRTISYIENGKLTPFPLPIPPTVTREPKVPKVDFHHGTTNGYANYRCRCDLCREAGNAARADHRKRSGPPRDGIPHGTLSGYQYHRCRCADCRKANTAMKSAYRWNPDKAITVQHGTTNGYNYYHCRCDACRKAESSRKRTRPSRAKAR